MRNTLIVAIFLSFLSFPSCNPVLPTHSTYVIAPETANVPPGGYVLIDGRDGRVIETNSDPALLLSIVTGRLSSLQGKYKDTGASLFLKSGDYHLDGGTLPIDLISNLKVELDQGANLIVPNGYSGVVFRLRDRYDRCIINAGFSGGRIKEDDYNDLIPQKLWTAIQLRSSKISKYVIRTDHAGECAGNKDYILGGVTFCSFKDIFIQDAGIAIQLLIDGPHGYLTCNEFKSLKIWNPKMFVDFKMFRPERPTAPPRPPLWLEDTRARRGTGTMPIISGPMRNEYCVTTRRSTTRRQRT